MSNKICLSSSYSCFYFLEHVVVFNYCEAQVAGWFYSFIFFLFTYFLYVDFASPEYILSLLEMSLTLQLSEILALVCWSFHFMYYVYISYFMNNLAFTCFLSQITKKTFLLYPISCFLFSDEKHILNMLTVVWCLRCLEWKNPNQ